VPRIKLHRFRDTFITNKLRDDGSYCFVSSMLFTGRHETLDLIEFTGTPNKVPRA
jgi:hypothetical protein